LVGSNKREIEGMPSICEYNLSFVGVMSTVNPLNCRARRH